MHQPGKVRAEMISEWFRLATRRSVILRASKYAAVVGAILIAINHGDAILTGQIAGDRLLRMGLTVMVPYFVSTFSSCGALREQTRSEPT